MSEYNGWQQCGYCRKWVRNKPIIGTVHFCLTEEERAEVDLRAQKKTVPVIVPSENER
jgi:hypothetical protein